MALWAEEEHFKKAGRGQPHWTLGQGQDSEGKKAHGLRQRGQGGCLLEAHFSCGARRWWLWVEKREG